MQALAAAGMDAADIGKKVQINTSVTVAKYLDPYRLDRLERHKRSHDCI